LLDAEQSGGRLEDVRVTEPSCARRIEGLRGKYADFLTEALDLQKDLRGMIQVLDRVTGSPGKQKQAGPIEKLVRLDLNTIGKRLEQFRQDLEDHRQEEINLVLESVTTDLGGGD